jgi:RNA polymerase sigma-70 factor (ECF subfamily)
MIETNPISEKPRNMSRSMTPAIEAALTGHYYEFRRYLLRRVGDSTTAEDVLQNFCMRVINSGTILRNRESVVAWLYTVLRSVLTDHYRSTAVRRRREASYAQDQMVLGENHVEIKSEEKACSCLRKLLPALQLGYAEILQRVDLSGESREQAAADLGITSSNTRVRLHRARKALRTSLEAFCSNCSEHKFRNCTCQPVLNASSSAMRKLPSAH